LSASINAIGLSLRPAELNGGPGAQVRDAAGGLVNVFSLEVDHGKIGVVRSVINPDKVRHLGELADREPLFEALHRTRTGYPAALRPYATSWRPTAGAEHGS
jgi:hypothetical protein